MLQNNIDINSDLICPNMTIKPSDLGGGRQNLTLKTHHPSGSIAKPK